jgi:hypothetical protein
VIACTLVEGFLVSLRCACDALAVALAVASCGKPGQAPQDSLRALLNWAAKNQDRVDPKLRPILTSDAGWFWNLRTLRDYLIHQGSHAFIFWNGDEFRLTLAPRFEGGPVMAPLLPLLASLSEQFLAFAYRATAAVQEIVSLPQGQKRSRVLHSPFMPYLKALRDYCPDPPSPAYYATDPP